MSPVAPVLRSVSQDFDVHQIHLGINLHEYLGSHGREAL